MYCHLLPPKAEAHAKGKGYGTSSLQTIKSNFAKLIEIAVAPILGKSLWNGNGHLKHLNTCIRGLTEDDQFKDQIQRPLLAYHVHGNQIRLAVSVVEGRRLPSV